MNTPDLIKKTLDHLLDLPANKDGAALQLVMAQGVLAGAVKKGPVDGVYNVRVVADQKGTNKKVMIDALVPATEIQQIHMTVEEQLVKGVGNGLIVP